MPKHALLDVTVSIDDVDLSDHCNAVAAEDSAEEVEISGFGSGYREFTQGLKDATITITALNDYDSASVHATLQPLYESGETFEVQLTPTSATVSATNPSATMTARLFSYSGISGGLGEASSTELVFRNASPTEGIVWDDGT